MPRLLSSPMGNAGGLDEQIMKNNCEIKKKLLNFN